ncbi:MAG: hypothetical protein ACLFQS_02590 [Bacteroidales bacterium]
MENKRWVILIFMVSFTFFSSCEDWLDVTESFDYQHDFIIDTSTTEYNNESVVVLSEEESLIEDYGDKIKNMDVEQIKFWVKSHQGTDEQALIEGTFSVARADGSDKSVIAYYENLNISDLVNTPMELDLNSDGVNLLEQLMETSPFSLTLILDGSVNEAPLDFVVTVEITAKMTANPLN